MESPLLFSCRGVDRIEIAVPASDEKDAVRIRGRCVNDVAGFEFPFQFAGRGVERVEVAVTTAEVDRTVRHDRTGKKNVVLIRNRLVLREKPVDSFRFEPTFAFGRELPFDRARPGVEPVKLSVIARGVNESVCDRRSARRRSGRCAFPNLPAGFRVDRVDVSVIAAEIDHLIVPDRRRHDSIARRKLPFHPMKLPRRLRCGLSGMRRVTAKHRLGVGRSRKAKQRDRNHGGALCDFCHVDPATAGETSDHFCALGT